MFHSSSTVLVLVVLQIRREVGHDTRLFAAKHPIVTSVSTLLSVQHAGLI